MTLRAIARTLLPVLLVLYPLLLLLDSVEPGFVRSVVNPHVFLIALIVIAMLAPHDDARAWSKRTIFVFGVSAAIIAGAWVWWSVGRGTLALFVSLLAAVAVGAMVYSMGSDRSGDL